MAMNRARRISILMVLLLFSVRLFAPSSVCLVIEHRTPVNPYKQLINAIGKVETNYDTLAYNPVEQAAGFFQIRPIRLEDYNKRTGSRYKMKDLFNYEISEKIFLYYAAMTDPHDLEKIARKWNGSGAKTIEYWKRVKKQL